jgi:hypothetical protein
MEHFMDLNYLYERQQVSLVKAERAGTAQARQIHLELAERYGERIDELRSSNIGARPQ